jgi:ATP phosphoribosyltransferase
LYGFESKKDNFPKPRIILGSTPNLRNNIKNPKIKDLESKTIYTSYPKISQKFFKENNTKVNIVERQGTIEGRWRTNLNNWAIVDVVNSGDTLNANGIEILQEILLPKIVYIENKNMTNQDKLRVNDLQELLYIASNY